MLDGDGTIVATFTTLGAAKAYCLAHADRDDLFIPIAANARLIDDPPARKKKSLGV